MSAKNLTAKGCEKAKADPTKRRDLRDKVVPGLVLVIHPTGRKSWVHWYRFFGRRTKLTLGAYVPEGDKAKPTKTLPKLGGPLTLTEARQLGRWALAELAEGRDPADDKRNTREARRTGSNLFPEVLKRFVAHYPKQHAGKAWCGAKTAGLHPDGRLIEGTPAKAWEHRPVDSITTREVNDLLDEIAERAPVQANRTLAALRKFWKYAVKRELTRENPCLGIEPPGGREIPRDRYLDDDEIRVVWRAPVSSSVYGIIVRLLLLTGARAAMVGGMRWSEIDLESRTWTVPRERMKRAIAHEIFLSESAVKILEGVPVIEGCDFVFGRTGKTGFSGWSKAKRLLDADLGEDFKAWRLHDLRRTMASGMARLGVALHVVEKCLAHESGSFRGVVGTYQRHDFGNEKRDAWNRWASHIEGLVAETKGADVLPIRKAGEL